MDKTLFEERHCTNSVIRSIPSVALKVLHSEKNQTLVLFKNPQKEQVFRMDIKLVFGLLLEHAHNVCNLMTGKVVRLVYEKILNEISLVYM